MEKAERLDGQTDEEEAGGATKRHDRGTQRDGAAEERNGGVQQRGAAESAAERRDGGARRRGGRADYGPGGHTSRRAGLGRDAAAMRGGGGQADGWRDGRIVGRKWLKIPPTRYDRSGPSTGTEAAGAEVAFLRVPAVAVLPAPADALRTPAEEVLPALEAAAPAEALLPAREAFVPALAALFVSLPAAVPAGAEATSRASARRSAAYLRHQGAMPHSPQRGERAMQT